MVMRTAGYAEGAQLAQPVAYSTASNDGGRTWSLAKPEPLLYNAGSKGFYGRDSQGRYIYVYSANPERLPLHYKVQRKTGEWSDTRVFFDGGVRNSYPTLVEETPGVFLCIWDSSDDAARPRTAIRFARLKISD